MPTRRRLLQAFPMLSLPLLPSLSQAQTDAAPPAWPGERPVRFLVSASAGGSLDTLMRPLAQVINTLSGGKYVVENQGGAAGMLAAAAVVRAEPNGHTLLTGGIHHMILPLAYAKMPYNTARDLNPIALIATVPNVVLVRNDSPIRSIQDLIASAKASPRGLNYGTGGQGSLQHLSTEYFCRLTGAPMQAVHYKGSAPAIADLLGGQIDLMFETMPNALTHVRSTSLRALAVTSSQRSSQLPDTPTLAEAGVPELVVTTWYGIFSPAGIQPQTQAQIKAQLDTALASPALQKVWHDYGAKVDGPGSRDFKAFVQSELQNWARIAKKIDFKPAQ